MPKNAVLLSELQYPTQRKQPAPSVTGEAWAGVLYSEQGDLGGTEGNGREPPRGTAGG